ncbi:MAG: S41 family peptidase [Chitinophagaceae bacterium]
MKPITATLLLFILTRPSLCAQVNFNGSFEQLENGKPRGWLLTYAQNQDEGYTTSLDSIEKRSGKYAMSLEKRTDKANYAAVGWSTYQSYEGTTVEVRGYIKTKDITRGSAGLWMRVEGRSGNLMAEFMEKDGPRGTTGWKKYSLLYKYDRDEVASINVGGILLGNGKAWFDDLELLIDGKPINQSKTYLARGKQGDTTFRDGSGILLTTVTSQQQINLSFAGEFWSFLKYHHPSVAKGDYYWDAELFRILPGVIEARNNEELSRALEAYLDTFPKPPVCESCASEQKNDISLMPDYGNLFNGKIAGKSLSGKLDYIRNNRNTGSNYYVSLAAGVRNPSFTNERPYGQMIYPDAGYRLLCLYRYWAMVNYFFPYRHQTEPNWHQVLQESIPEFLSAKNEKEYTIAVLSLIAKVKDTHANIWSNNRALTSFKGRWGTPVQARFIEGKLVVTGYYTDSFGLRDKLKTGDEIVAINNREVEQLIKEYLPVTPASNYETQLRDLPNNYLLRSNDTVIKLKVKSDKGLREVVIPTVDLSLTFKNIDYQNSNGYFLINKDIAYVYPAKYKNEDLPAIKKLFANAKGMVIDMRCYPSDFMPFTFGNYIKAKKSDFVKFSIPDLSNPGQFSFTPTLKNGGGGGFRGNVIVIVNATSQSNAEYTTMAFQSSPNVKVLGSITAGADGNISSITLPGGISTVFSGIGVFYPDGSPTQRVGVRIDYPVQPTIKGIREGRDELLEKAIELLHKGW